MFDSDEDNNKLLKFKARNDPNTFSHTRGFVRAWYGVLLSAVEAKPKVSGMFSRTVVWLGVVARILASLRSSKAI